MTKMCFVATHLYGRQFSHKLPSSAWQFPQMPPIGDPPGILIRHRVGGLKGPGPGGWPGDGRVGTAGVYGKGKRPSRPSPHPHLRKVIFVAVSFAYYIYQRPEHIFKHFASEKLCSGKLWGNPFLRV